ncbi:hypothetical protein RUM44_010056 [Polyplax serrata]|uniref:Peptidylprolyl isomerase n=1 Tax=Polyplax serrata TaxID=468196 RepID=A0ABR1AVZ9_POLSC
MIGPKGYDSNGKKGGHQTFLGPPNQFDSTISYKIEIATLSFRKYVPQPDIKLDCVLLDVGLIKGPDGSGGGGRGTNIDRREEAVEKGKREVTEDNMAAS